MGGYIVMLVLGILLLIIVIPCLILMIREGINDITELIFILPLLLGLFFTVMGSIKIKEINTSYTKVFALQEVADNCYIVQLNEGHKTYYAYKEADSYQISKVQLSGNCYVINSTENYRLEEVKLKGKEYSNYYFYIPIDSIKF